MEVEGAVLTQRQRFAEGEVCNFEGTAKMRLLVPSVGSAGASTTKKRQRARPHSMTQARFQGPLTKFLGSVVRWYKAQTISDGSSVLYTIVLLQLEQLRTWRHHH